MDRIKNFEKSQFYENFEQLEKKIKDFDISQISDTNDSSEYRRFKKVMDYIRNYINLIDVDLITQNDIDNLENIHIYKNAQRNINNFLSNPQTQDISSANTNIDNVLDCVKNHLIKAIPPNKKTVSNVFNSYSDAVNKELEKINIQKTLEHKTKIDEYYEEISNLKEDAKEKFDNIDNKNSDVDKYHNNITDINTTTVSINEEINNEKEEIFEKIKKIEEKIQESSAKQDELNQFYIKIFGSLNEKQQREGGLDKKFEQDQEEFNKYKKKQEEILNSLQEKINSLMPNATSVGLAKAFSDESKKLKRSIWLWTGAFIISIGISIYISYITKSGLDLTNTQDIIMFIIKSLPLSFMVWLTIFCAKRRSEANMLYQEYKHKETFANSYSSYKQQIEATGKEGESLLPKLIGEALNIISKNPSDVLEKKQDTSLPVKEVLKNMKK